MRLVQFASESGVRHVGLVDREGSALQMLDNATSVYELALEAGRLNCELADVVQQRANDQMADYGTLVDRRLLLPPLDHPDPAHCHVTGTGLTHLGSAKARDSMHSDAESESETPVTDSMKLFQWGVDGGKPAGDEISVQPEWFYKGSGHCIVPPEHSLSVPAYALDGGEEAELVGLYVIADDGSVLRVGFALGNEFSDHVMERQNYLYLAHSKLRTCSFGPELLIGELPTDIRGRVRIVRGEEEIWSDEFLTGEENMSYTIANLEHHQFKYAGFRRPGDVHCHYFGTATLSFSAGIKAESGDVFEISAPGFGKPLRNPIEVDDSPPERVKVRAL